MSAAKHITGDEHMKRFLPSAVALSLAATFSHGAMAKAAAINMDDIERMVVTASGFEQKLTEAPASISVITNEDLRLRSFTSLLDAVKFQEGVDIGQSW